MTVRTLVIVLLLLTLAVAGQAQDCFSGTAPVALRGNKPNRVAGPLAWSGSRLAVAKTDSDSGAIYVATYDEAFHQLSDDAFITGATLNGPLALFWTGTDFGLFFLTPDGALMLQRTTEEGMPVGGPVAVTPNHGFFTEDEIDFTWDPVRRAYAIVRSITQGPEKGLWVSLVQRDGTTISDRLIYFFVALPAFPRIAAATDGTIGVFFEHQLIPGITYIALHPDGSQLAPQQISAVRPRRLVVAASGNRFGLAKWTDISGNRTEIRWQLIDSAGRTLVSDRTLVAPRGVDAQPVALLHTGSEWALAYNDAIFGLSQFAEYRLRRFTDSGALLSDTHFSPERLRSTFLTRFPFLWTGRSFVTSVSFAGSRAEGSDSYLVRHCPLAARAAADRTHALVLEPISFSASASGGTPAYAFEWDFGDRTLTQFGPNVTHTYDRPGRYIVTLTTTDEAGARHVTTREVIVIAVTKRRVVRK